MPREVGESIATLENQQLLSMQDEEKIQENFIRISKIKEKFNEGATRINALIAKVQEDTSSIFCNENNVNNLNINLNNLIII